MIKSAIQRRVFTQLIAHARTPLYRNAYALMLGTAATSGLGLLYWALAARLYTPPDIGVNAAAISTMMFLSGIAQLNLSSALLRFIPRAGHATARLTSYAYLISLAAAVGVSAVFLLGYAAWAPAQRFLEDGPFALWFLAATAMWCVFVLQDAVLTSLRQAIWVPIENTIFAILKIALLAAFAVALPRYGVFASWTIPVALSLLPVNLLIFRRLVPAHARATAGQAALVEPAQVARYVAGDYLGSLFSLASTMLLPALVLGLAGASGSAYFYAAWTIVYSLDLIASNMAASLTVEGAADQASLAAHARGALINIARLLVPLVLLVLAGAPFILRIYGASYAAEGAPLLRLLALGSLPKAINVLFYGLARVRRRVAEIALAQGAACALVLGLSYLLIPSHGIVGVGLAWLAGQTAVALVVSLARLRPIYFPAHEPNDHRADPEVSRC
jgi:O-antigen/teichoic acid export membrane protein